MAEPLSLGEYNPAAAKLDLLLSTKFVIPPLRPIFCNEGIPLARLLTKYLDEQHRRYAGQPPSTAYVHMLLSSFGESDHAEAGDESLRPSRHGYLDWPIETLTTREIEVLRLIAGGASNRDIARELVVSLGTVKKHLNNIFGKLDAHSRTQAVAKARDIGALPR